MRENNNRGSISREDIIEKVFPKFLRMTYVIVILCTILISNSFSLLSEEETMLSAGVVDYIAVNLRTAPITDIIFNEDTGENFPEYEKLSIYNWPGAKKENTGFFSPMKFLGTNNTTQTNKEGFLTSQIPAYFPVNSNNNEIILERSRSIYNWGNNTFFVRRNINFLYKSSHENCQKDFIECSPNLCVSQTEKCPITSLVLQDETSILTTNKAPSNLTQTQLFNIEVSMLDKPCNAMGAAPEKENAYGGLFLINGCGKYGQDNSAEIISTKREIVLFHENYLHYILQELPAFRETIKNDEAYLVTRQRIPLTDSKECYQGNIPESKDFQKTLNTFKSYGDVHLGIQINALIGLAFTFLIKNKEFLTLLDTTCFISLFLTIWTVWVMFYNIVHLKGINNFAYLIQNQCFYDNNLTQALIDFNRIVHKVIFPIYAFTIALSLITLVQTIVYYYARRSRIFSNDIYNLRRVENQSPRTSETQQNYTAPLLDEENQNLDERNSPRLNRMYSRPEASTRTQSVEMNVFKVNKEKNSD